LTDEMIQDHMIMNCRNDHGEPIMDEHTFFKGAKWARDQQQVSEVWKDFKKSDLGNPIQLQSERPVQDTCKCDAATCEQYTHGTKCHTCGKPLSEKGE